MSGVYKKPGGQWYARIMHQGRRHTKGHEVDRISAIVIRNQMIWELYGPGGLVKWWKRNYRHELVVIPPPSTPLVETSEPSEPPDLMAEWERMVDEHREVNQDIDNL